MPLVKSNAVAELAFAAGEVAEGAAASTVAAVADCAMDENGGDVNAALGVGI